MGFTPICTYGQYALVILKERETEFSYQSHQVMLVLMDKIGQTVRW
jgi:hypothetical protein